LYQGCRERAPTVLLRSLPLALLAAGGLLMQASTAAVLRTATSSRLFKLVPFVRGALSHQDGFCRPGTLLWEPLSSEFTREAPAVLMPI
jgi:hypothetical protein